MWSNICDMKNGSSTSLITFIKFSFSLDFKELMWSMGFASKFCLLSEEFALIFRKFLGINLV